MNDQLINIGVGLQRKRVFSRPRSTEMKWGLRLKEEAQDGYDPLGENRMRILSLFDHSTRQPFQQTQKFCMQLALFRTTGYDDQNRLFDMNQWKRNEL